MYTFDQDTEKITRTRSANRSSSRFAPGYDEDEQQSFLPFGEDEHDYDSDQSNEVQEYNRVSSFTDVNQDEERHMYIQTLRQEREESKKRFRLNARGIIALCVISIILTSLIGLAIYNAVLINDLNATVLSKNQSVATQTAVIKGLETEYNELAVEVQDGVNMGFRETTPSDYVEVIASPKATKTTTVVETNWFDRLCEFFSRLFG